jgi:signal transduction histidine kinase
MITKLLKHLATGAGQVVHQPRILFVLLLVVAFPILLTVMFQQFQDVATDNYSTAARLRIGTVHDSSASIVQATKADTATLAQYVQMTLESNPDIFDMVLAREEGDEIIIVAGRDSDAVGSQVLDTTPYTRALATPGRPLAFEFYAEGERFWDTTSSFSHNGETWYVVTRQTFLNFDTVMANRELVAYGVLGFAFLFLFGLGYWLIRDIDYKTKYNQLSQKLEEQSAISNLIVHELRSPLTAMRGYASMITEQTDVAPNIKEHAVRITDSTERLIHLVNDFLEVVRLQSGQLSVSLAPAVVGTIISKVADELRPLANEKNLELVLEVDAAMPVELMTDAARLHQVLTNVTSNAIKYTPSGRITIELRDSRKSVEIRVKDTGTGINADDQQKLFAPFFRVQSEYTSGVTGTGLGMWITKQLVARLGGTIGIESIKNVGTNVVLTFNKQAFSTK